MSSRPQLAPATGFSSRAFERVLSRAEYSNRATEISCPSVLLVGRNGSWGSAMLRALARCESELTYVAPDSINPQFAREQSHRLILLDSTVPAGQRRQVVSEFIGSDASVFYSFPVENDCWWLPVMRHGRECHGAPAFRRGEFPAEIERILKAQTAG